MGHYRVGVRDPPPALASRYPQAAMRRHLATPIPEDLAREAQELIRRVRESPSPRRHRREGVGLVLRLTEAGMEGFFLRSVERMRLGFLAESATRTALKTAFGALSILIKRLAGALSDEQVRRLAELMDEMLVEVAPGEED